jgi:muramoyltetrapeptide carboxypeptidase
MVPPFRSRLKYLAGSDEVRAEQLRRAFSEEEIRGVFCTRGGYGAMRLLSTLDPGKLGLNPKVFVGFSDLTVLLSQFLTGAAMVGFHGPTMTSRDLAAGPESRTSRALFRAVMEGGPPDPILGESWAGGVAEGPLMGGCLSMLTALVGTPFFPRLGGAILFLEDVNERLYRIDRMLCQLRMAGILKDIRGVAIGEMVGCARQEREGALREVFLDVLGPLDIPVVFGLPCGHGEVNLTLPLGCRARLDGESGSLSFLEAGTA